MRPRYFSILATCWLLALTAFEIYHFVKGVPWPGYTPVVNYISLFYAAIFLTGCYYLARYQLSRPVWPFIAFTAAFVHGVMIRAGSGWQGYVLVPSGLILFALGAASLKYRKPLARVYPAGHYPDRRRAA